MNKIIWQFIIATSLLNKTSINGHPELERVYIRAIDALKVISLPPSRLTVGEHYEIFHRP